MNVPHHIVWPGAVVALLGASLLTGAITITLATRDPSFAVEPDYYERALAWDDDAARARQSEALGWSAVIAVASRGDALGDRPVTIDLTDADGLPIENAAVTATVFHKARSSDRATITFKHASGGRYTAALSNPMLGAWSINITAARGRDQFLSSSQVWIFAEEAP